MVEVKCYNLPPTKLIPNSPFPLLHYRGLFKEEDIQIGDLWELYKKNGWRTHWIFRYGPTQQSHYHSKAHECMTVLTGTATIRFGVADTSDDLEKSTHGHAWEEGGVEIEAKAGDVFILPAGTAHKTHNTKGSQFALLTPGNGKGIAGDDPKKTLQEIQASGEVKGFCMMGAYPNGSSWDFAVGAEDDGHFQETWSVPKPERDPVMGSASQGLCGQWHANGNAHRMSKL